MPSDSAAVQDRKNDSQHQAISARETDDCIITPAQDGIRLTKTTRLSPAGNDVIDLSLHNITACTGYSKIQIRVSWQNQDGKELAYSTYIKEKQRLLPPGTTRQYTIMVGDHVSGAAKIEAVIENATSVFYRR